MTTNDAVAKRILQLMRENNYTQYRIEQKSAVYHGAMQRILDGKNKSVTLVTIYKLARGFNMSVLEFLDHPIFADENIEIE